jgi:hypothetical protein
MAERLIEFVAELKEVLDPAAPTNALPGSPEKIAVLEERARLRLSLFNPEDLDCGRGKTCHAHHDAVPVPDAAQMLRWRLQCDRVIEMHKMGIEPKMIAQLLDILPEQVTETLQLVTELEGAPTVQARPLAVPRFAPNRLQRLILAALEGEALSKNVLRQVVGKRIFGKHGLGLLRKRGLVRFHQRYGYYRPDRPPPELGE